MGTLGRCPTCNQEISTSAESCSNCGECHFQTKQTVEQGTFTCDDCAGRGFDVEHVKHAILVDDGVKPKPFWRAWIRTVCLKCWGSGKRKRYELRTVDLRTGVVTDIKTCTDSCGKQGIDYESPAYVFGSQADALAGRNPTTIKDVENKVLAGWKFTRRRCPGTYRRCRIGRDNGYPGPWYNRPKVFVFTCDKCGCERSGGPVYDSTAPSSSSRYKERCLCYQELVSGFFGESWRCS